MTDLVNSASSVEESGTETIKETVAATEAAAAKKSIHEMTKEELLAEIKGFIDAGNVNAHKEVLAIKQALFVIRQREINEELNAFVEAGNAPEDFSATPDVAETEMKDLVVKFREMRNAWLETEEKRRSENLEKKRDVLARMKAIINDADNINLQFDKFSELRQEFKAISDVPPTAETEIWKEYQSVSEQFYDTLKINKELRDLDFKKNLEAKKQLIARTIALDLESDIIEAGRKLQQLHAEWREIGPVMKELREEVWEEFKQASTIINRKHQEFFQKRKAEEQANEDAKRALCEEIEKIDIEPLKTYAAWDEAANRVKELQARYREIGFAARKANNELFARFRAACDKFFEAKAAFSQSLKESLQANLEKKMQLCEKAEALGNAEELHKNLEQVIALQAEWKKIGPVNRKFSDSLWDRFMNACSKVFEAHRKSQAARINEENSNLAAKREVISKLEAISLDLPPREGLKQLKELQAAWMAIGHVPYKQKEIVFQAYRKICDKLYDTFNASRKTERRQSYEGQISQLRGDDRKLRDEREKLRRAIEGKRQDLKNYSNNLAFFNVKSSAGNSLVKDIERKMSRLQEDIKEIQEKLALLDSSSK